VIDGKEKDMSDGMDPARWAEGKNKTDSTPNASDGPRSEFKANTDEGRRPTPVAGIAIVAFDDGTVGIVVGDRGTEVPVAPPADEFEVGAPGGKAGGIEFRGCEPRRQAAESV